VEEPAVLNPKFTFFSPVRNAGTEMLEHVDHAIIALDGRAPVGGDWTLERLQPVTGGEVLRVELWVNDLGDYTCTYGFLITSEDGRTPHARGERTVVNIDARSRRTEKWSSDFRQTHAELLKDLPAYA
jgi:acyl-CoA thioesterase FadM